MFKLPALPHDKQLHLAAGALIAASAYFLFGNPAAALLTGILAGDCKELYDYWSNLRAAKAGVAPTHDVDFFDQLATSGGALIATVAIYAIVKIL
jgi:hypothetical protein